MNSETIERRLFVVANAFVGKHMPIKGNVYYRGLRPISPNQSDYQEDAIVAFLAGTSGDVQKGTCLLNVYVSDTQAPSGMYYKDKTRCEEIAAVLEKFPAFANSKDEDIYFKQSDMIRTIAEEEIHQHFVSLKMEFKVLNENY
ncbi:MAG: hypothetical protein IJ640_00865 [Prevotella sp.]|nr:hypothetical protein [Prevotella sp.]